MKKNLIKLACLSAVIGGLFGTQLEAKRSPKVDICHFRGHDTVNPRNNRTVNDFVLTGAGGRCNRLEGDIISISENALKGHGINTAGVPE